MKTQQYLGQLRNIDKRIKDKIEEAEQWKAIAESTTGHLNEIKVQSSPSQQKMQDAIVLAIEYEEESKNLATELTKIKHKIIEQIDGLEEELYYNILKAYYINNKSLTEISVMENYSYKQMKRYYDKAINKFEEKYGKEYLNLVHKCPKKSTSV